jgi:hypothetical protein
MSEGVLSVAALFHVFDFQLACERNEIKRVLNGLAQPNKMPVIISKRK